MGSRALAAAILACASALVAQAAESTKRCNIEHCDIDVEVGDESIAIRAKLRVHAGKGAETLRLELADPMRVTAVQAGAKVLPFRRTSGALTVDVPRSARGRVLELTVEASGRPWNQFSKQHGGFLRTCVTPEITYIRSQYAWNPRIRDDAATYRITVLAKRSWIVCTAGTPHDPVPEGERSRSVFEAKRPVRSVGLVAGPYERVQVAAEGLELEALVFERHREAAKTLLDAAARARSFYTRTFGALDGARFSIVEMPAAFGRGSGYGEDGYALIGEGAFESAGAAPWAESLIAHEVSHAWWGREVGFANFAHESLACWATLAFVRAERGEAAARHMRREAVENVLRAAAEGREMPLAAIRSYGAGIEPATYQAMAYDKGMMLLSMIEDAAGTERFADELARLFRTQRGKTIDWTAVRAALADLGPAARALLAQFEVPGIPALAIESKSAAITDGVELRGQLVQSGTGKPFPMCIELAAVCAEGIVRGQVDAGAAQTPFVLALASEPKAIVIDPDYRLLARRPAAVDADAAIKPRVQVINSPGVAEPKLLRETIAALEQLLVLGAGKYESVCYTGIGRCHFRLGEHDAAIRAFEHSLRLGSGGPFHRSWVYLRLGNIADVRKDRVRALQYYRLAKAQGQQYAAAKRAAGYLSEPYPGYAVAK